MMLSLWNCNVLPLTDEPFMEIVSRICRSALTVKNASASNLFRGNLQSVITIWNDKAYLIKGIFFGDINWKNFHSRDERVGILPVSMLTNVNKVAKGSRIWCKDKGCEKEKGGCFLIWLQVRLYSLTIQVRVILRKTVPRCGQFNSGRSTRDGCSTKKQVVSK